MEHLDAAVSPSHPSPRKSTPTRMKPSRAVSYTADTRHRALGGALLLSEGSSLSPGKRLHHQRSSSSHDASPHPQGERPAPVAGRKFSDIGYGIVGQRRCRTRRATRRSRRQIHQWGCRAPRLCERERRGSSKFGRSGPRYPRALCSSQWLRHILNEKQRAARAVARKTEATVRVSRRSVGRHVSRL